MLLAGMFILASCADDNDSNPTLIKPTEFVLNQPEAGLERLDLQKSEGINISWSQPVYTTMNAPVIATYTIQVSNVGTFNKEFDETMEDNTDADFISLPTTPTVCNTTISTAELDKALMQLNTWSENEVPSYLDLALRVKAAVIDAGLNNHNEIISNVVSIKAIPYYIELSDAPVVMWYLVGNMFGGKWGNVIGETALPMFIVPGYDYDKKTGCGEITYTNYFTTGDFEDTKNECGTAGFKIQPSDFDWNHGFTGDNVDKAGAQCSKGTIILRNGGDGGHIVAPEDGYYKITVNTDKKTAKMEKLDITPNTFASVCLSGSFNEWGDTPMTAYNKDGVENHTWYSVVDFDADQQVKFKQEGSWDSNWGSVDFPNGNGVNNGENIAVPAGKWLIIFCDITGEYNFIAM